MSGIYLHIPFCRKACHYCDFHFSTSLAQKDDVLKALSTELEIRAGNFRNEKIETIYFGGGTPSLLSSSEIASLLDKIYGLFSLSETPEITLEANPDDLSREKLAELLTAGINRLSIGVQSFYDEDLAWMNRSHRSEEALKSILNAAAAGIHNISMDLIFGYPLLSMEKWEKNIEIALSLPINHLSTYSMTVEKGTALDYQVKKGISLPMPEYGAAAQYDRLMTLMNTGDWEHYEISNFARKGHYSKHNSSYWKSHSYLGIGPSAHGFAGDKRYWNIANNSKYVSALRDNILPQEEEHLGLYESYNEYVMTRLRTMWGVNLNELEKKFGTGLREYFEQEVKDMKKEEWFMLAGNTYTLLPKARGLADHVISQLFRV